MLSEKDLAIERIAEKTKAARRVRNGHRATPPHRCLSAALIRAAARGELRKVRRLVALGASPTFEDEMGRTALGEALRHCHFTVANALDGGMR